MDPSQNGKSGETRSGASRARLRWLLVLVPLGLLPFLLLGRGEGAGGPLTGEAVRDFVEEARNCTVTPSPAACLNEITQAKAPVLGIRNVLVGLEQAVVEHPDFFAAECHRSAHYLGEYAGETIADVDAALALGTAVCQFGFFHGVIEGHARVTKTLREELPTLCDKLETDKETTAHAECSHSLGHAVVTRTDNDVPSGLAWCSMLLTSPERRACGTGIFMSWSNTLDKELQAHAGDVAKITQKLLIAPLERRWEICPGFDDEMAAACVLFLVETSPVQPYSPESLTTNLHDFRQWCQRTFAGRPPVAEMCDNGVGRVAGGVATFEPIGGWPGVIALCLRGDDQRATERCTENAYGSAAAFNVGKDMASAVCAAWKGHPLEKGECAKAKEMYRAVTGG